MSQNNRPRAWLVKVVQYGLATVALGWVVSTGELHRTAALLGNVTAWAIGLILLVTGIEFGTRFSMWYVLLNGRHPTPFATAARIDVLIKFINHLIPSKASGHSLAPIVIHHFTDSDWTESVTIAGLNTGLYATLYGIVAVLGIVTIFPRLSTAVLIVVGLSAGLYLGIGVGILTVGRRLDVVTSPVAWVATRLGALPLVGDIVRTLPDELPSFTERSSALFRELSNRPWILGVYSLSWAGTLMIAPGIRVWVLMTEFGEPFTPAILLPVVLVVAYSVTILPLTPGGIGIAEASAVVVFVSLGVPQWVALPVVLIDRFLGVYLPALLGWYPMTQVDLSALGLTEPIEGARKP